MLILNSGSEIRPYQRQPISLPLPQRTILWQNLSWILFRSRVIFSFANTQDWKVMCISLEIQLVMTVITVRLQETVLLTNRAVRSA